MGWFWSSPFQEPAFPAGRQGPHASLPPATCPMHKSDYKSDSKSESVTREMMARNARSTSKCPVQSAGARSTTTLDNTRGNGLVSKLNPLNYMPSVLSQERSSQQKQSLPTSRTASTIPRGDSESTWEYPSPQQMYNALLRKGYDDTPEDAIESMVEVHNFLNEGAWNEIEGWEARFGKGLFSGWQACRQGEEAWNAKVEAWNTAYDLGNQQKSIKETWFTPEEAPRLIRFMGRPGDMTPKASMMEVARRVFPSKFGGEAPFDRHDWFIRRSLPDGTSKEVRYVIDYYSGPPEPTGEPVFYLDVRPAVDSPTAALERLVRWGGDVWYRASGASAREAQSTPA